MIKTTRVPLLPARYSLILSHDRLKVQSVGYPVRTDARSWSTTLLATASLGYSCPPTPQCFSLVSCVKLFPFTILLLAIH